jgi:hypothetical protein
MAQKNKNYAAVLLASTRLKKDWACLALPVCIFFM